VEEADRLGREVDRPEKAEAADRLEEAEQRGSEGSHNSRRNGHQARSSTCNWDKGSPRPLVQDLGEERLLPASTHNHHRKCRQVRGVRRNWGNSIVLTYLRRIVVLSLIALRSESVSTLVAAVSTPCLSRVTASCAVALDRSAV